MDKDRLHATIEWDIDSYEELMEDFKSSFLEDSEKHFKLYHAAESVYVALWNLKKVCDGD